MATATTQTVDEFTRDFATIARRFEQEEDFSDVLEQCADDILDGIEDNFRRAQTSEGERWPPRKDPGPTHPLLILTGALMLAATRGNIRRITKDTLELGVSKDTIVYAGVHQFGWPEKNIAARPYLGCSLEVMRACQERLADRALAVFD